MKQKLEALAWVLIGVVVTVAALRLGIFVIDWGLSGLFVYLTKCGWRAWLELGESLLALLALLLLAASGFVKEPVTTVVEGVHDGP